MQSQGKNLFEEKPASKAALDENADARNLLEIRIVESNEEYEEIEINYGGKKRRKRIPRNIADRMSLSETPSAKVGAMNLGHLARGSNLILQEKFLGILSKINHVSQIQTPEKIWDSNERINTTEKAILVAVINRLRPENEKLDRVIVSMKSHEIPDQKSFNKFIADVLDLANNSEKLITILFGDLSKNLPQDKKSVLSGCIRNIISETDESKHQHQLKFLQKIIDTLSNERSNSA